MQKTLFTKKTQAIFYNQHPEPIQRMLDYDWLCKRETPSIAAIVNPSSSGLHRCFWGTEEILIPVFKSTKEASKEFPDADVFVNFASMRSAYESSKEALLIKTIRTVAITAEGIPENETRELIRIANENNKVIIGPATVGAIKPGSFRVGNTGGSIDNLMDAKLYRPGSVGVVTVSGGMSSEIYHLVAKYADGTYEGVAIGGDKFPGSTLLENILRLEKDPAVKMFVVLGELGGTSEYEIAEALKTKIISKPLVAWVAGTVAKQFNTEVQFGHAGAKSGKDIESAQAKNQALAKAGAFVPKSFNELGLTIQQVFNKYVMKKNYTKPNDKNFRATPEDFKDAVKEGKVRRPTSITSSISDDRGEELTYNKKQISDYASKSIGHTINALWFKGRLSATGEEFIELCLKLSADHGPAVATAHNAIVAARAGKDLVSSVIAGLTTIGPRHGGAIDDAAKWAFTCVQQKINSRQFVEDMKNKRELIMGIGHRIKTAQNPDKRVSLLKNFATKKLKKTEYLKFALEVEKETLKKKNNLILNVDGAIGVIFLDILTEAKFTSEEIIAILESGALNGIFVLARTIGIIGHVIDQKRLNEGLYRHPWDDILYI